MQEETKPKGSIARKIFLFLGFVGLVFVALAIYRETEKKKQIQGEIQKLQEEADKINKDNLNIQDKISYLDSSDYKEKEARDKLNLQKPDENVVVVKPEIAKEPANEGAAPVVNYQEPEQIPNYKQWWNYFFKY